jgi:hypothetical protein
MLGAGERLFGRAANLPSIRPRKPTDDDMSPHNWGGGEARPKGGGRMRRKKARVNPSRDRRGASAFYGPVFPLSCAKISFAARAPSAAPPSM